MGPHRLRSGFVLHGLVTALAIGAAAGPAWAKSPCTDGIPRTADFGFRAFTCNCALRNVDGNVAWRFLDEPQIGAVVRGGPADGRLEEGDVITAIDGALITTRDGASRFARAEPGEAVVLTVRRNGAERPVRIVPGEVCASELVLAGSNRWSYGFLAPVTPPTPPAAAPRAVEAPAPVDAVDPVEPPSQVRTPRTPRTPRAPRPPGAADMAPRARAKGWLGVGLSCVECGISADAPEGERVWEFHDLPEISYVDPQSPAARSGLRRGDVLTDIDGHSLLTEEGGRHFGAVRPGQSVRLAYRRGDERGTLTVVAMARPDADMELARVMADLREQLRVLESQKESTEETRKSMTELRRLTRVDPEVWRAKRSLRYSGAVGSSDVEVRGLGTVAVSKDEDTGELVITTADATIRVRPAEYKPPKKK